MPIITEVTKSHASSGFNTKLFYLLFRKIEGNRYAEEVSVCETVVFDDTV
jgi:hypothetical protein